MDLGLKGKKVIMNGGAHGLGLASLRHFAAEGADVAFFSRKQDKTDAAREAIAKAGNGKVFAEVLDMAGNPVTYGHPDKDFISPEFVASAGHIPPLDLLDLAENG